MTFCAAIKHSRWRFREVSYLAGEMFGCCSTQDCLCTTCFVFFLPLFLHLTVLILIHKLFCFYSSFLLPPSWVKGWGKVREHWEGCAALSCLLRLTYDSLEKQRCRTERLHINRYSIHIKKHFFTYNRKTTCFFHMLRTSQSSLKKINFLKSEKVEITAENLTHFPKRSVTYAFLQKLSDENMP